MPYAIPLRCTLQPTYRVSRPGLTDERVTWHLDNWASWMRGPVSPQGFRSRSYFGCSATRSFDAMVAEVDKDCARAVDVLVDGLQPALRAAVHNAHLGAVFRVRDQTKMYSDAREQIRGGLNRRGIA